MTNVMTQQPRKTSWFNAVLKTGTLAAFGGALFLSSVSTSYADIRSNSETYKQLNLFGDVFERVKEQYVDEVSDEELIEAAISGMLTSLDPHSSYLDEDAYKDMRVQTKGAFGGLGIEVTMENGYIKVVSPIDDTPAFRAGVQAGDFITHLDGEPVLGLDLSEAVDKMRGKIGTTIVITVRREGEPEALEIKIKRDVIRIKSVRHRLEGDVGYVRITTFSQQTASELAKAIKAIKKEAKDGVIGYVLDLRNNPGGLLTQAIAVSDAFLDKGEIVSTRGREDNNTERDNATKGDLADGKPMVVLINGGSASASEIVSGALQDHRRAVIMGTESFGKGSVQTIISLPGHGAMRLTTARYYTPSGRSIQAKGIDPDIVVEQATVESLKGNGKGVREKDLRGALDRFNNKKNSSSGDDELDDKSAIPSKKKEGEEAEDQKDYQLSRALDLLRGLALYDKNSVEHLMMGNKE